MADPIKPREIAAILKEYSISIADGTTHKIQKYLELMNTWGRKMPLTSIQNPEQVVRFHFGESMFALALEDISNGRLADLGSGAGFPGLALKLARPSPSVTLIESNKKKCAFLQEVIRSLDIHGAKVMASGFESSLIAPNSLSFVTCRALAQHSKVVDWARERLAPGGSVILWLGEKDCEEVAATGGWEWSQPALIPGTRGRFILRGKPKR